ncbi:MAG: hypothetical protein WD023_01900 [Ilumatobacteraceae bacterium]
MSADRRVAADPVVPRYSRRHLLALSGVIGAGLVLAACGDDTQEAVDDTEVPGNPQGFVVAQRYPQSQALTPGDVRLAISLASTDGALITTGPDVLRGIVRDATATEVAAFETPRRGAGLGVPYWSITANLATPGIYDFMLEGAAGDPTPFILFDPAETTVASPSQALAPFDTPTTADARGVDPICTRLDGPCPFHEVTLAEALAAGKPVVYLVGTPAHCVTATCGPGLDFLIEVAKAYEGAATFIHAEVYADPAGTKVAPAVTATGLDYEPAIFVTDATGTIVRRIDIVWDQAELAEMLAAALA